jgi:glycosyltransferase involved in cell wall biosynthesis
MEGRPQRVAFMLLPGLDHFTPDLIAGMSSASLEVRPFHVRTIADLTAACAWADDPAQDVIWFEFCWPPFPAMIAANDFGGRRVMLRVHRIEAYETRHAATAPWAKIDDVIVVSAHMASVLKAEVPALAQSTALHVVHNGVDTERFSPPEHPPTHADPFRIGWCGALILRKNPVMALEILHHLRREDPRWHLHLCAKGGERVAIESFNHLKRCLGLDEAVRLDGDIPASDMPAWHACNAVLLSTCLHESFGYAIAEAASCGCDIAMLDQPGADEFWPAQMRFATMQGAARLIRAGQPGRWRGLVQQHFSLQRQIGTLRRLLQPDPSPP